MLLRRVWKNDLQSKDMKTLSVDDIAKRLTLPMRGAGKQQLCGVASLTSAGPNQLSFLANSRLRAMLPQTRAGVVIVREEDADMAPCTVLIASNPYTAFAKAAHLFEPDSANQWGVHPSAVIDPTARIANNTAIAPGAIVGARSVIEAGSRIGPGCIIGEDCVIGSDCHLIARVTLVTHVVLGQRVRIHPGAVLGADGFGLAMDQGHWINVPQRGGVRIGDDCEIGANACIDRGALDDTILEEDVRIDNLVQIAHNCRIGAHTAIAGCTGIAGSASIGRYCLLGGQVGVVGHLQICDHVVITGQSAVRNSIDTPGEYSSGTPLTDNKTWRKNAARFKQLDRLARQVQTVCKEKE